MSGLPRADVDERELGSLVGAWLGSTLEPLPTRVRRDVLEQVAELPQDRAWGPARWPLGRRDRPRPPVGLAAAIATLLLAIALFGLFGAYSVILPPTELDVGASPSQSPAPSHVAEASAIPSIELSGREIVVDLGGGGDATSIAQALGMAQRGDRILVRPGRHDASFVIDKDVIIEGDGPRGSVILESREHGQRQRTGGTTSQRYSVLFDQTQAVLRGLTIAWPSREDLKIVIAGGAPTLDDVALPPNGPNRVRLLLTEDSEATVSDSEIGVRVLVEGGGLTVDASRLRNIIQALGDSSTVTLRDSEVRLTAADANVEHPAVYVGWGASGEITGNDFAAEPRAGERPRTAIAIERGLAEIRDNDIRDSGIGISVEMANPLIAGNQLRSNGIGLSIGCASPRLERNVVVGNDVGLASATCPLVVGTDPVLSVDRTSNRIVDNGEDIVTAAESTRFIDPARLTQPTTRLQGSIDTLLTRATTETVEPGVTRFLDDGAGNDLTDPDGSLLWPSTFSPGAVFAWWQRDGLRVAGQPEVIPGPFGGGVARRVAVEASGDWWALADFDVAASRDDGWTLYAGRTGGPVAAFEARPGGGMDLGWLEDGHIVFYESRPESVELQPSRLAPLKTDGILSFRNRLAYGPDGTVWLLEHRSWPKHSWRLPSRLWRHGDEGWTEERPVVDGRDVEPLFFDAAPDGTLWVYLRDTPESTDTLGRLKEGAFGAGRHLARRHPDGSWTVWSSEAARPGAMMGDPNPADPVLADTLAPAVEQGPLEATDDGVWLRSGPPGCSGAIRFDGEDLVRILDGVCVAEIVAAPDGALWISGAADRTQAIYRVIP